jgi:hypothetical protein
VGPTGQRRGSRAGSESCTGARNDAREASTEVTDHPLDRCEPERRRKSVRLLGAFTLLVVLMATAFGGHRYYFCRAMGEVMTQATTCACATVKAEHDGQPAFRAPNDCLELRSIDRLVSFTTAESPTVHAAPLVAILPALPMPGPALSAALQRAERAIRAGPPAPSPSRAKLMVFLT